MEKALRQYLNEYELCQAACEETSQLSSVKDLYPDLAGWYNGVTNAHRPCNMTTKCWVPLVSQSPRRIKGNPKQRWIWGERSRIFYLYKGSFICFIYTLLFLKFNLLFIILFLFIIKTYTKFAMLAIVDLSLPNNYVQSHWMGLQALRILDKMFICIFTIPITNVPIHE